MMLCVTYSTSILLFHLQYRDDPLEQMRTLGSAETERPLLIGHEIIFEIFQPM